MPKVSQDLIRSAVLWAVFIVQLVCTLFFTSLLASEVFGLRTWSVPWEFREVLQLGASFGLVVGSLAMALYLRQSRAQMRDMRLQVAAAAGEFHRVMERYFTHWGLTPAERDVAMFAVKGLSNREIAEVRGKSESTIKVQMNAVLRKAGVDNRAQLVSHFVEDLLHIEPEAE